MTRFHRAIVAIATLALISSIGCGDDSSVSGSLLVSHRNGDIYEMDRKTGEATIITSVYVFDSVSTAIAGAGPSAGSAPTIDVTHISSLAYDIDADILFAGIGGSGGFSGQIFEVDLVTGEATDAYDNNMGDVNSWPGLTVRQSDGYLFGHMEYDDDIWIFDETGAFSDSFEIDVSGWGNALTFNESESRLYHGDGYDEDVTTIGSLEEIDPADGTILSEKVLTFSSLEPFLEADGEFGEEPRLISLTVAKDTGTAYGILQDFSEVDRIRFLVKVSLSSARVTHIATFEEDFQGLVYVPKGVVPEPAPEL